MSTNPSLKQIVQNYYLSALLVAILLLEFSAWVVTFSHMQNIEKDLTTARI